MANNYSHFTVLPYLPAEWFTPEVREHFQKRGIEIEGAPNDTLVYLYCEDEQVFDEDGEEFNSSLAEDLQKLLREHESNIIVTIEGCWYCDKMRSGEFGGFVHVVSRFRSLHSNTQSQGLKLAARLKKGLKDAAISS